MQIEKWQLIAQHDEWIRDQFKGLSSEALNDSFYKSLEFGTAGMRGLLGVGPNRMNSYTVGRANYGFAQYLLETFIGKQIKVAIAYDNRHMSKEFAQVSANILSHFGIKVYLFSSLRPTPELSFAVRYLGCQGGIVITASHNPKEYNGYKIYDETGCQLVDYKVQRVIELIAELPDPAEINLDVGQAHLIEMIDDALDSEYLSSIKSIQLRPEAEKSVKIVFTPQHGTASPLLPSLLKNLGYTVIEVEEQTYPDPDFSNTITPNPEDKASYNLAIEYAKKYDADLILSCDPDADRMGIVVKHMGEYVYLSGNQGGSILQEYIYSTRNEKGIMPKKPIMFNTVVTSDLGEKIAKKYDVEVEKTLTGFKYIGEKIEEHNIHKDASFVFGYEESYGYLISDFVRDKDAFQACLMVAEAANFYLSKGLTLVDVLDNLYEEFGYHFEHQISITRAGEKGLQEIQQILTDFRSYKKDTIAGIEILYLEDFLIGKRSDGLELNYPSSNVLKFSMKDGSWIAIRPSGTEPKCKFYFCIVGESSEKTREKYEQFESFIKEVAKI